MKKVVDILKGEWKWKYLIPAYAVLFLIGLGIGNLIAYAL